MGLKDAKREKPAQEEAIRDTGNIETVSYTHLDVYKRQHGIHGQWNPTRHRSLCR